MAVSVRNNLKTRTSDYNRWRRHSACGGLSPEQFENQNLA
ncbi:IS3 family transposase [Salmonella enterica]